ncbi:MAG: serine/threonine protein kinase, partial [Acidobacteria bacterium]
MTIIPTFRSRFCRRAVLTFDAGTTVGPYEILSHLGAGGQGEVYKARDKRLNRFVAIKVLLYSLSQNVELKTRFEREAQTLASLSHPHICPVFDVGRQDEIDYLVMEYIEGETLAEKLKNGRLPLDLALRLAIEIADALDKAHRQGIAHRDVKPSNIMLTKSGAKLLDFGLAKRGVESNISNSVSQLPTDAGLTAHGTILGTLQYMSPEQLEGQEADARSDIFGFGATLYEMVTGAKAFEGKSHV